MTIEELLELCREYADVGWSIQEQLHAYVAAEDPSELNPKALDVIDGFLHRAVELGVEADDLVAERGP